MEDSATSYVWLRRNRGGKLSRGSIDHDLTEAGLNKNRLWTRGAKANRDEESSHEVAVEKLTQFLLVTTAQQQTKTHR